MARTDDPTAVRGILSGEDTAGHSVEALSDREGLSSAASQENVCDSPTPSDLRTVERASTPSPRSGSDGASHASAPSPLPEPDFERWWTELGANYARADGQLPDDYAAAQRSTLEAKVAAEIAQDLHRTFPRNVTFNAIRGPERLGNVLRAYAIRNPDVGYCQSMNFITGFMLIYAHKTWPEMSATQQEERVFWMLCAIVESPKYNRGYYNRKGSTSTLHTDVRVLEALTQQFLPEVHARLAAYTLLYHQLVLKWFATVFLYDMTHNPSFLIRQVWESYVVEGSVVLFRTTISLLAMCELDILEREQEDMMVVFFDRVHKIRDEHLAVDQVVHNPERKSDITAALVEQLRTRFGAPLGETPRFCADAMCCPQRRGPDPAADKSARVCSLGGGGDDVCVIA